MIASKTYESFKNIWSIKEIGKDYLLTNTKEKLSFKWVHNNLGTNMRMLRSSWSWKNTIKVIKKKCQKKKTISKYISERVV